MNFSTLLRTPVNGGQGYESVTAHLRQRLCSNDPIRLVIVEDDSNDVAALNHSLAKLQTVYPIETQVFFNAETALTWLERNGGDVCAAFINLNLPGMQGDKLLAVINTKWCGIKTAIVSGMDGNAIQSLGIGTWIAKPFLVVHIAKVFHDWHLFDEEEYEKALAIEK